MNSDLQCGHSVLQEQCPHCRGLQAHWYLLIESKGFDDVEKKDFTVKPVAFESTVGNIFPENPFSSHEKFLYSVHFDELCKIICRHGNHKLGADKIKEVWVRYIDGGSNREIACAIGINDTLVWRTINKLTQWMQLMDLDETREVSVAKVVLRELRETIDTPFIYASWRNSLWYDSNSKREGDSDTFYRNTTSDIRKILKDKNLRVRIACLSDDPSFIVGYSVTSGGCLQFVYVKVDYRNKGIGSLLVPKDILSVSHSMLTKAGRAIAIKRGFIKEEKGEENGKAEGIKESN